jgi:hypothetical protein
MVKKNIKNNSKRVVKKRVKNHKTILHSNSSSLRFDPSSNGLAQKMASMQVGVSSGQLGTEMLGTTGNYYLDTIVDPFRAPVRVPDEYVRPTALHQSFAYFTVDSSSAGESCIFLNPTLGTSASTAFGAGAGNVRNSWVTQFDPTLTSGYKYADPDWAVFTTAIAPAVTPVVSGIRPVSAAMLVSFIGNTLEDGGQISAAWLPGDLSNAELSDLLAPGGLQKLALKPGAYTGPISKGAYTFWKPDDIHDSQFQSLTNATAHSYPILCVCFKSTKNSTTTVRVSAVTNYEINSVTRVLDQQPGEVEPDLMLHARRILSSYPTSCANDGHVTLWQRIQQGCKDFFQTIGESFRNLFAPSLADISANSQALGHIARAVGGVASGAPMQLAFNI